MTVTEQAPEIYPGYPYKRRVFPAWQQMWNVLRQADGPVEGRSLAEEVAADHGLSTQTLAAVLARAAKAGLLTTSMVETTIEVTRQIQSRPAPSTFSTRRSYAHYQIAGK